MTHVSQSFTPSFPVFKSILFNKSTWISFSSAWNPFLKVFKNGIGLQWRPPSELSWFPCFHSKNTIKNEKGSRLMFFVSRCFRLPRGYRYTFILLTLPFLTPASSNPFSQKWWWKITQICPVRIPFQSLLVE